MEEKDIQELTDRVMEGWLGYAQRWLDPKYLTDIKAPAKQLFTSFVDDYWRFITIWLGPYSNDADVLMSNDEAKSLDNEWDSDGQTYGNKNFDLMTRIEKMSFLARHVERDGDLLKRAFYDMLAYRTRYWEDKQPCNEYKDIAPRAQADLLGEALKNELMHEYFIKYPEVFRQPQPYK